MTPDLKEYLPGEEIQQENGIFSLSLSALCPYKSRLLFFDLFLVATYVFNNLLNFTKLIPYIMQVRKILSLEIQEAN